MKPVYGIDLRKAVRVTLILSADLHENKRHRYIDRRSKFSQTCIDECLSVPSAVFNSVALRNDVTYEDYKLPMCRVSDIDDQDDEMEDMMIDTE